MSEKYSVTSDIAYNGSKPSKVVYTGSGASSAECRHIYYNSSLVFNKHGIDDAVLGMTESEAESYLSSTYGSDSAWKVVTGTGSVLNGKALCLAWGDDATASISAKPKFFTPASVSCKCSVCGNSYTSDGVYAQATYECSGDALDSSSTTSSYNVSLGGPNGDSAIYGSSSFNEGLFLCTIGEGELGYTNWISAVSISEPLPNLRRYWSGVFVPLSKTAVTSVDLPGLTSYIDALLFLVYYPSLGCWSQRVELNIGELNYAVIYSAFNMPSNFPDDDLISISNFSVDTRSSTGLTDSRIHYFDSLEEALTYHTELSEMYKLHINVGDYSLIGGDPTVSVEYGGVSGGVTLYADVWEMSRYRHVDLGANSLYIPCRIINAFQKELSEDGSFRKIASPPSDDEFYLGKAVPCASGVIGDARALCLRLEKVDSEVASSTMAAFTTSKVRPCANDSSSKKVNDTSNDERFYVAYAPSTSYGLGKNLSTQLYLFINWTPTYAKSSRDFNILRINKNGSFWRAYRYKRSDKVATGYYSKYSSTANSSYVANHYSGYVNSANSTGGDSSAYIPIATDTGYYDIKSVDEVASASTSV